MLNNLQLSDAGIALIKSEETCSLRAYWDVTGWAIGYGHHNPALNSETIWTENECVSAFLNDIESVQISVRELVHGSLTQGQYDALVDFCYNIGAGSFAASHVLIRINDGEFDQVPNELRRWVYVNHIVNPGLEQRRENEIKLWQS